jgi:hypothetical protein
MSPYNIHASVQEYEPDSLSDAKHEMFLLKSIQASPQDRLTRVQVLFTRNLSPLQSSKFSFEYLLLPPRSALWTIPLGFTSQASALDPHALLLITAHASRRNGPVSVTRFSAIHFQGWFIRQVSCYTLLSGFRLPWPPSCCLNEPTPFVGST